jgi:hypothetical protein
LLAKVFRADASTTCKRKKKIFTQSVAVGNSAS